MLYEAVYAFRNIFVCVWSYPLPPSCKVQGSTFCSRYTEFQCKVKEERATGSALLQPDLHAGSHVPSLQLRWGSAPTHSVPHPQACLGPAPWWTEAAGRHPSYPPKDCHCWLRQGQLSWGWWWLGKLIRDWQIWKEGVNCIQGERRIHFQARSRVTEEAQSFLAEFSLNVQLSFHP